MLEYMHNGSCIKADLEKGTVTSIKLGNTEIISGETPIFEIRLLDKNGKKYETDAQKAEKCSLYGNTAVYSGFEYDITVTVRAESKELCSWYISVENNTEYQIEWVKFPCISLAALKDNGGIAEVLYPYNEGVIVSDIELRQRSFGHKEPEYPSQGSYCIFPNMICSQFMAYLVQEKGLYFGAHDSGRAPKGVEFYKKGNGICMCFRLYIGSGFGGGASTEYPIVIDSFEGDWHDGAEMYRRWFEENLPEGAVKIRDNEALPEWYKDSPLVISYPVRGIHDMDEMYPNALFPYSNALPIIQEISAKTEARLLVLLMHWEGSAPWAPPYVWPAYGGEEMFNKFKDELHRRGDLLGVYCSGFGYTIQSNLVAEYNMSEEYNAKGYADAMCAAPGGDIGISRICTGQRSGYDICVASEKGREILDKAYEPLLRSGVDYAQILDQNHGGGQYFCYSEKHGHPAAPGRWMTDEMRKLLGSWNKTAGKMLLGCESAAAEAFIPNLLYSDNRYELNYMIGNPVPMYAYIYHEYLRNFMGNQVCCGLAHIKDGKTVDTMRLRLAYSFAAGDSMTLVITPEGKLMANWGNHDFEHVPDMELTLEFCRNMTRFYKKEAGEFLHCARMIKPMKYECEKADFGTTQGITLSIPKVFSTAWEKDGRRVQIFVNHTEQTCNVEVGGKQLEIAALDAVMLGI